MRLLLLGDTGLEPGFSAWESSLRRAGVPFDAVAARGEHGPVYVQSRAGNLRYHGLILTDPGLCRAVLDSRQHAILLAAERELGLRLLETYAYPSPRCGLQTPAWAGDLAGVTATLTDSGRNLFPYLRGSVPITAGSWGYLSTPALDGSFEALLLGPDDSSLLGIHTDRHGCERMIQTFDCNRDQLHGRLLRHGQLAWLTRGAYLGHQRNYLSVHIDDVLLPNRGWDRSGDPAGASAGSEPATLRMSSADAARTARWSRRRKIRLDLVFNGAGSEEFARVSDIGQDPLLEALLACRETFGWINHTYRHLNLDEAPRAAIEAEIECNLAWAARNGIELEPDVLVTGEHTGLANLTASPPRRENPHLAVALRAKRIRFVGCDASRPYPRAGAGLGSRPLMPGTPFMIGGVLAVPRHPTVLAYDAATRDQLLDRLRVAGATLVGSWPDVATAEATRIVAGVLGNDPLPHYFHQSNLIARTDDRQAGGTSLLCSLLDQTLDLYESLISASMPVVQPSMSEVGRHLLRVQRWRRVCASGKVHGYLDNSTVSIINMTGRRVEVPLTGVVAGEDYAGNRSGWLTVSPGTTLFERLPPDVRPRS